MSTPAHAFQSSANGEVLWGFFEFDPEIAYDFSMYAITRKLLLLVTLVAILAVVVPITHSQDGVHVSIADLKERVVSLEKLPVQVAELSTRLDIMDKQIESRDEHNASLLTALAVGMGVIVIERILAVVFGIKPKGSK